MAYKHPIFITNCLELRIEISLIRQHEIEWNQFFSQLVCCSTYD